jgi:hypothetical protein
VRRDGCGLITPDTFIMKRILRDDWTICNKTARGLVGFEGYNEGIARRQIPPPEDSIDREQASLDRGEAFETVRPAILKDALERGRLLRLGNGLKLGLQGVMLDLEKVFPSHDLDVLRELPGSYAFARHCLPFAHRASMHGYMPVQQLRDDMAKLVGLARHQVATDGVIAALCTERHAVWLDGVWLCVGGLSFSTAHLHFPTKLPPILAWSARASAEEKAARNRTKCDALAKQRSLASLMERRP